MEEASAVRFRFSLTPVDQVGTWGGGSLHWFGLTAGTYWIELGDHRFPQFDNDSFADYYLARFWEDLRLLAPAALESVPADLVEFLHTDIQLDDDAVDDPDCEAALNWFGDHFLDFGYLVGAPKNLWWRLGDELMVTWWHRGKPPIRAVIPVDEFVTALADFDRELMAAMEERVSQLEAEGVPPGVGLDVAWLRREHGERSRGLRDTMSETRNTDWAAIRAGARRCS